MEREIDPELAQPFIAFAMCVRLIAIVSANASNPRVSETLDAFPIRSECLLRVTSGDRGDTDRCLVYR